MLGGYSGWGGRTARALFYIAAKLATAPDRARWRKAPAGVLWCGKPRPGDRVPRFAGAEVRRATPIDLD